MRETPIVDRLYETTEPQEVGLTRGLDYQNLCYLREGHIFVYCNNSRIAEGRIVRQFITFEHFLLGELA